MPILHGSTRKKFDAQQVRKLAVGLNHHLALLALLGDKIPGTIYFAEQEQSAFCLAAAGRRMFLCEASENQPDFSFLNQVFLTDLRVKALAGTGPDSFELHFPQPAWLDRLSESLVDFNPLVGQRVYYEFSGETSPEPVSFPLGYNIREADQDLLADDSLLRRTELEEEMCSERPTVQDFLDKSFGLCLVYENEIVGWCLSEYNLDSRCEIGIAVHTPHRRQGLAANLTRAFLHLAQQKGIKQVGWHSWKDNLASTATAHRAGFSLRTEEPVLYGWFDPVIHHAVGGNVHLSAGRYDQAAAWYQQAFALGQAPGWAYWNAAVNYMNLGQTLDALSHIRKAVESGFQDMEHIQTSQHFEALHGSPDWEELLADLQTRGPNLGTANEAKN